MINQNQITPQKPEIKEEKSVRKMTHEGKDGEARYHFDACAEALRDPGDNWLGSYMVHIYENPLLKQVSWKTMDNFKPRMTENVVSQSLTDLRTYLMDKFGRQERKRK